MQPAILPFECKARRGALPIGGIFALIGIVACAATGLLGLDHLPFTLCALKAATACSLMLGKRPSSPRSRCT